jgi:hypothetical protein
VPRGLPGGAFDLPAAGLGAGAAGDFEAHLSIATSSFITVHVPFKKTDVFHTIASLPCGRPDRYMLMAAQEIAGAGLTFLRDQIVGAIVPGRGEKEIGMDPTVFADLYQEILHSLKPYRDIFERRFALPKEGVPRPQALQEVQAMSEIEARRWSVGRVSGAVYHGDPEHVAFLNQVYAAQSQNNPLHADVWPSTTKFEAEIVAMTSAMLGAPAAGQANPPAEVCGVVTSGGTESILLAMKAYRDWGRAEKGITEPEIIAPTTAHAAFDKAAGTFGLRLRRIPVGADFRADVAATRAALSPQTVAIVGSAPPFPHGIVDPIEELSEVARAHGAGFHTDGCLGGFLLPWAERLGYPVPSFDFRLPGVTSISADTHTAMPRRGRPFCFIGRSRFAGISFTPSPTGREGCTSLRRWRGVGRED